MARPNNNNICSKCGAERVRVIRSYARAKYAPCGVCEFREQKRMLEHARKRDRRTA